LLSRCAFGIVCCDFRLLWTHRFFSFTPFFIYFFLHLPPRTSHPIAQTSATDKNDGSDRQNDQALTTDNNQVSPSSKQSWEEDAQLSDYHDLLQVHHTRHITHTTHNNAISDFPASFSHTLYVPTIPFLSPLPADGGDVERQKREPNKHRHHSARTVHNQVLTCPLYLRI
jgi:hypothetical protein